MISPKLGSPRRVIVHPKASLYYFFVFFKTECYGSRTPYVVTHSHSHNLDLPLADTTIVPHHFVPKTQRDVAICTRYISVVTTDPISISDGVC